MALLCNWNRSRCLPSACLWLIDCLLMPATLCSLWCRLLPDYTFRNICFKILCACLCVFVRLCLCVSVDVYVCVHLWMLLINSKFRYFMFILRLWQTDILKVWEQKWSASYCDVIPYSTKNSFLFICSRLYFGFSFNLRTVVPLTSCALLDYNNYRNNNLLINYGNMNINVSCF